MEAHTLIELTQRLLLLVLMVSLPVVSATVLIGLVVGVFSGGYPIQDPSIGFGVKLVACVAIITALGPWAGAELMQFGNSVFESIVRHGR